MILPFSYPADHHVLGTTGGRLFEWPYTIPPADIQNHMHVIGKSNSGKSRFLAALTLSLLSHGFSVTLIDPHGTLADLVLAHLVAQGLYDNGEGYERIMYLDLPEATRRKRYLPFNVLHTPYDPATRARLVLEALRRAYPAMAGGVAPNFENIVLAGVSILIYHDLPLSCLHDVLVNKPWRDELLKGVGDREVVRFFKDRYDRWGRDQADKIESTLNKIFLMLFAPVTRYSLGQSGNSLNFKEHLAHGRSFLVNLHLDDPDAKRLLGCLLTVSVEQAAQARIGTTNIAPHFLIIDEFSEFSAQSSQALTDMLSQTRKGSVYVVLAHQTLGQLDDRMLAALQNCGFEVVYTLGYDDAARTAPAFLEPDPLRIKHEVQDEAAAGRTHPAYYSLPEQHHEQIQEIYRLPRRHALIRDPYGAVARIRTVPVPDPSVNPKKLKAVKDNYLTWCLNRPG
ncbi:MAG TPA: hypothetical protein VK066_18485 [Chloroflexota bacterium]|nr:hypothetical protein [Chloroflexota bacterium]